MKHLPKALRPKRRYLAVGIESTPEASFGRGDFQRELWYAAQNLVGDVGSADADLTVIQFHFEDGTGEAIVRARHGHTETARASLACIASINGADCGLHVRGISGTIRGCEEKYLGRPSEGPRQRTVAFEHDDRAAIERDSVLDVRVNGEYIGATNLDFQ
ncbi:Rpp14/Pop5 family protein [Haloarchaeobius sp. DYHT-AS-18]|uniref:Rpp14/Pop5 family protein n=1 Tax=Haloarchaeobius sp. DYHT-AS-18 TaxID=3446117 RepID=UPI003EBDEBF5